MRIQFVKIALGLLTFCGAGRLGFAEDGTEPPKWPAGVTWSQGYSSRGKTDHGEFRPILNVVTEEVRVGEPVEIMAGVECVSGYWDGGVLNPFMESKWPVCLSIAVFNQEHQFVSFLIPPKLGPKDIPEVAAWTFISAKSRVGTRMRVPETPAASRSVFTTPGVYFLQAVCTERMFSRRPWSASDDYAKQYRKSWLSLRLDRECCRSEIVKIIVQPSNPQQQGKSEIKRQEPPPEQYVHKVPLRCRISRSDKSPLTVGDELRVDVMFENISDHDLFIRDPLLEFIDGSKPDLQLMVWNDNGDVVGDLNERRRISYTILPASRLPPAGWRVRDSTLWHQWTWSGDFTLQVIYGPKTFATRCEYDEAMQMENGDLDGNRTNSKPADALHPEAVDDKAELQRFRVQSNPLRFKVVSADQ